MGVVVSAAGSGSVYGLDNGTAMMDSRQDSAFA
jgi:hypothetical protein